MGRSASFSDHSFWICDVTAGCVLDGESELNDVFTGVELLVELYSPDPGPAGAGLSGAADDRTITITTSAPGEQLLEIAPGGLAHALLVVTP
jgi:hypothetical protein